MQQISIKGFAGLLILVMVPIFMFAQISSPNASFIDSTDYISAELGRDPIFVYTPKRGSYPADELMVANLAGYDSLTFYWIKFNFDTHLFNDTVLVEKNVSTSKYTGSGDSGFKILMQNSKVDTAFYIWNYVSAFQISDINIYLSTCEFMELKTYLDYDDEGFTYYDRIANETIIKAHTIEKKSWEVSIEGIEVPNDINPHFVAPVEYARFTLTIIDNFNQEATGYVDIEEEEQDAQDGTRYLIATKADFEASRYGFPSTETDTSGQAPFLVQFVNNSLNATEYAWTFYTEKAYRKTHEQDSVMETSIYRIPLDSIRYEMPAWYEGATGKDNGIYGVALEVKGPVYEVAGEDQQCIDRELKEEYIVVDSVFVPNFANVFTPNGDTKNDYFYFADGKTSGFIGTRSVKSFSIKIYSRWGVKVHEYYGDIDEWEGWDGMTNDKTTANTGVYFYSAFIEGYDGKSHGKDGFIHLFR